MSRFQKHPQTRRVLTSMRLLLAGLAGGATAVLVGVAIAKAPTLQVARQAKVVNANTGAITHENIVVTAGGSAVYTLSGDSKSHPKCTKANGCFSFWPPVKVASRKDLSKASGIPGRLGVFHRDGFFQVTLGGHPVYRYAQDTKRHVATGQDIHGFQGTWHVIKAAGSGGGGTSSTTTSTPGMTTTTTPCVPYPGYPCP